jgi:hypothetical protein
MDYITAIKNIKLSPDQMLSENRFLAICGIFQELKNIGMTSKDLNIDISKEIYSLFAKKMPIKLETIYIDHVLYDIKKASKILSIKPQPVVVETKSEDEGDIVINADLCNPKEIDNDFIKEMKGE